MFSFKANAKRILKERRQKKWKHFHFNLTVLHVFNLSFCHIFPEDFAYVLAYFNQSEKNILHSQMWCTTFVYILDVDIPSCVIKLWIRHLVNSHGIYCSVIDIWGSGIWCQTFFSLFNFWLLSFTHYRPKADRQKCVKEYHRPTVGVQDTDLADIRPPEVLSQTLEYLVNT